MEKIMVWTYDIIKSGSIRLIIKIVLLLILLLLMISWLCGKFIYTYLDKLMKYITWEIKTVRIFKTDQPTIDWIDVESVAWFLFDYDWLPTEDAKHRLWLSNKWVTKLGDNLDRVGITAKDPKNNNRRTLVCQDPGYVTTLLLSHPDSDKIWSYTAGGVDFMVKPLEYAEQNQ